MTNVTKEQARTRYSILPLALQNAIFSDQTVNVIDTIGAQSGIPDEKIGEIASAVALVLLGFIHPEDLAKELQDRMGINAQIAGNLSLSIENKIFAPIRGEINKAYDPPSKFEAGAAPKMIDISDKPPLPSSFSGIPKIAPSPAAPPPKAAAGFPVSAPVAQQSRPVPPPFGKPGNVPSAAPASMPQTGSGNAPQPAKDEPPPVLIHEESGAKPLAPNFRIDLPAPKIDQKPAPPAPKPAVLEFGGSQPEQLPPPPKAPPVKIVHYTDLRTPLPPAPGQAAGQQGGGPAMPAGQKPASPPAGSSPPTGGPPAGFRPAPMPPPPIENHPGISANRPAASEGNLSRPIPTPPINRPSPNPPAAPPPQANTPPSPPPSRPNPPPAPPPPPFR